MIAVKRWLVSCFKGGEIASETAIVTDSELPLNACTLTAPVVCHGKEVLCVFTIKRKGKGAGGRRVLDEVERPYLQKKGPDSWTVNVQVSSEIGVTDVDVGTTVHDMLILHRGQSRVLSVCLQVAPAAYDGAGLPLEIELSVKLDIYSCTDDSIGLFYSLFRTKNCGNAAGELHNAANLRNWFEATHFPFGCQATSALLSEPKLPDYNASHSLPIQQGPYSFPATAQHSQHGQLTSTSSTPGQVSSCCISCGSADY